MARTRRPRRDWSDGIPSELLGVVFLHLPCLADRVYFAAVCRAWRSAARGFAPPRQQLPWLLLPSPRASAYFAPQSGATRRFYLPEDVRDARLCGSHGGGWVTVAAHAWGGHAAVNLLSGARVPLPNRLNRRSSVYSLLLRTVVFSASPASEGCLAAAHVSSSTNIALWRSGMDKHWITCGDVVEGLEDIIYHKGDVHQGFHILTSNENVRVYTPTTDDGPLEISSVSYNVKRRVIVNQRQLVLSSVTRYLVESRGKLLMVLRYYNVRRSVDQRTIKFRIFEMKLEIDNGLSKASWVELVELTGRALFLGRGCSRAFEVSQFNRLQEGSIYYLDDTKFNISVALTNTSYFSSADMGMNIYGMLKTRAGVRKFTSESSPPIWFIPDSMGTVVSQ